MKKVPNQKKIYFWNIMGSFCNAVNSTVLLMFVTRMLTIEEGDTFSIAWTIAQLLFIIGTFQVRVFQATDLKEEYSFQQYTLFRKVTILIMVFSSIGYVFIKGYDIYKASIILLVCLYKLMDAISDVFQGCFQQKERLDLAGKAMTVRVIMCSVIFGTSIYYWGNLLLSCVLISISSVIFLLLFECRYIKFFNIKIQKIDTEKKKNTIISLLKKCLPLFINGFLTMSILNASKMAIDSCIAEGVLETGTQTIYSWIFMPAFVINLFLIVFRPLITKLAIYWNKNNVKKFINVVAKIIISIVIVTIVGIIAGTTIGIPILSIFSGINLNAYRDVLIVILIGGGFNAISNILDNTMTVIRKQHLLIVAYGFVWGYATVLSKVWISHLGVLGAGLSFMTSMILLSVIITIMLVCNISKYTLNQKDNEENNYV